MSKKEDFSQAFSQVPEEVSSLVGNIANRPAAARKTVPEPRQERQQNDFIVNDERAERKSKRIHLLVKPSVFQRITERAKKHGISRNDYINQLVEWALENEWKTKRS